MASVSRAQEKISITVSKDSIQVGEPFEVFVSLSYPIKRQVLFPDSNTSFKDFILLDKKHNNTISNDSISTDSAVYTFTSFELISPQYISIPIYLVTKNDSIELKSDSIPISILEITDSIPTTIEVKENLSAEKIPLKYNYIYLLITIGIGVWALSLILILFGKKAIRAFKVRQLLKSHNKFITTFRSIPSDITNAEKLLITWKFHIKKITKHPFDSYSTTEIYQITKSEELKEWLRTFDKMIYSNQNEGNIDQAKEGLLNFSQRFVDKRINKIKNGR